MMAWLRSMAGRVFLILLLGVLAATMLTWWLAFGERQRAFALQRDARLAELVEQSMATFDALPPSQRHEQAERSRRFGVRYEVLPTLPAAEVLAGPPGPITRALSERVSGEFPLTPLRATLESCPGPRARGPGMGPGGAGMGQGPALSPWPQAPRPPCEVVAARLKDGSFVRIGILPPRSPAPPLPPDLPLYIALFLACIGALVLAVTRMTVRPLRQLANAARAFGDDVYRPPLPLHGATEIRQATAAFNAMQARIRRQIEQRTEMLAAITHDLQTPLTRLRLRLEKVEDPALREKLVEDLSATQAMVKEGLALARSMDSSEPVQDLDLDSLLDSVCSDATDTGQDVTLKGQAGVTVRVRPTEMRRCLTNLVDNAVKYGQQARVSVQARSGQVSIRIADNGPGIPQDQMARVFEPFYRLESSRSRETGGTGLGLTIAKNIIEQHGGSIALANLPQGGLEVTLSLPAQRA